MKRNKVSVMESDKKMRDVKIFFQYVAPSVLSFALSGIYTIVDGLFIEEKAAYPQHSPIKNEGGIICHY